MAEFRRFAATPGGMGLMLAVTGLITWTALSIWCGLVEPEPGFHLREAWNAQAYFYLGLPLMALAVGSAAFVKPERIWRWPLWLVFGHQLGVMVVGVGMQSGLSLLILAIVLGVMLAVGLSIPAMLGAMAARALTERAI